MREKILAGIVLHNPDIKRLQLNINSVIKQVDELIIVDNCSDNLQQVYELCSQYLDGNILIVENYDNFGIATALNQIMQLSKNKKYNWSLLLDQDSICADNLIESYIKYIQCNNVAIVTPYINDLNYERSKSYEEFNLIDKCITSGSLNSVSVWEKVGKFNENFFIDLVDDEYSYRVKKNGYKILRVNDTEIIHEIGKIRRVNFFKFSFPVFNHSAFRKYYIIRNMIFFNKTYHIESKLRLLNRLLKQFLLVILYEDNKFNKIKSMFRGLRDGIIMEDYNVNNSK